MSLTTVASEYPLLCFQAAFVTPICSCFWCQQKSDSSVRITPFCLSPSDRSEMSNSATRRYGWCGSRVVGVTFRRKVRKCRWGQFIQLRCWERRMELLPTGDTRYAKAYVSLICVFDGLPRLLNRGLNSQYPARFATALAQHWRVHEQPIRYHPRRGVA